MNINVRHWLCSSRKGHWPCGRYGKRAGGTMLDISSLHKYRSFNRIWSRSAAILQSSINQLKSASRTLLESFQQTTKRTLIDSINRMVITLMITLIITMTEICGVSLMISLHSVADKFPSNWWSLWSQPIKNCPLLCESPSVDKGKPWQVVLNFDKYSRVTVFHRKEYALMLVVKMVNWNHFYYSLLHSECTPLRTMS